MPPAWLLSALMVGIYAALFHLWRGRTLGELPLFLLAALVGFVLGELAGDAIGLDILTIGPIHIVEASLGSWVALFIARWLKV